MMAEFTNYAISASEVVELPDYVWVNDEDDYTIEVSVLDSDIVRFENYCDSNNIEYKVI